MTISIVILAAGQGKRMHSDLPKVLQPMAGKPLLEHVVTTIASLNVSELPIVIYGHQGDKVRHELAHLNVKWVHQAEQLGTGHAALQALPHLPHKDRVLLLYGDVPLISAETLKKFITKTPANAVGVLTAHVPDPKGFGRIIRDTAGHIIRVVEEKDTTEKERVLTEINSGIYLIPAVMLKAWLPALENQNAQKEYYLTDIIAFAADNKFPIYGMQPATYEEVLGINDFVQLAMMERYFQQHYAEKLMRRGVRLLDPARFDIRGQLSVGHDVVFDINVVIEGDVTIGHNCTIGPHTIIRNSVIGDGVTIHAHSVIDGAEIASSCLIGPFARLRPGTILKEGTHIGNFVEIKNSVIDTETKINHLSYIGDASVGKEVNIGAGTITCNYDGVNKHQTIIGNNAFIGSNSQLIAPVTIGEHATIGAGSTITRDAPAHQLTLCRTPQRSVENWQRPSKKEKKDR